MRPSVCGGPLDMRYSLARFTYRLACSPTTWQPGCRAIWRVTGALTSRMERRKAWRRGHDSQGF